jgi:ubiquitin-protein ligase
MADKLKATQLELLEKYMLLSPGSAAFKMSKVVSAAVLRFKRDISNSRLPANFKLEQSSQNTAEFEITFQDGVYKDMTLIFEILIDESYPFTPPKVISKKPIFHPSVCPKSNVVCINLLRLEWRPTLDIESIVMSTFILFLDDSLIDTEDALNQEAADMFTHNYEHYATRTRQSAS